MPTLKPGMDDLCKGLSLKRDLVSSFVKTGFRSNYFFNSKFFQVLPAFALDKQTAAEVTFHQLLKESCLLVINSFCFSQPIFAYFRTKTERLEFESDLFKLRISSQVYL